MPEWYKALPPKIDKLDKFQNSTIKRCPPFLDAMSVGWIIPLAADIEIITNNDASGISWKCNFPEKLIETHGFNQVSSPKCPHPELPKPPLKFMNHWAIRVPVGYSVLFTPPMNRPDDRITCMSGIVDCDGYFEYINFPGFFNVPGFTGIIPAGTPLVQAIPFRRNAAITEAVIRGMDTNDTTELENTRLKRAVHESHYRDNVWEKK
jgi:hypothetical protein